jgi:autotransporter-associated beta strand protein
LLSGSKVNGYGGTTTVNSGTIVLSKTANGVTAIPNDLVIGNGSATAAVTTMNFARQIASGSNVTVNTNGTLTLSTAPAANTSLTEQIATLSGSGNVNLGAGTGGVGNAGRNTLLTGGKGAGAPFSGVISGTGNLTKYGGNTLVLTGQNIYTGSTSVGFKPTGMPVVDGGVLTVNGAIGTMTNRTGPVTVVKGTLNGTGSIFTIGPTKGVTIAADGKIKPGKSPGILTVGAGGFDMQSGSEFDEEIDRGPSGPIACNGAGCYSQLDVLDGTTLEDSTLSVTLDSALKVGDLFAVINNLDTLPVTGTFAGLPEDATFVVDFAGNDYLLQISYDGNAISPSSVTFDGGNDVVLAVVGITPVQEPGTLMILGAGLIGLMIVRRVPGCAVAFRRVTKIALAVHQVRA